MSYFLGPAVEKIRCVARAWMTRAALCYSNFSKNNRIGMFTMIFVLLILIGIGVMTIYKIINYEIGDIVNHEEIEALVLLLIISVCCVIKIHLLFAVIKKHEDNLIKLEHNNCIGKFAKGIIHDLLSPLSAIVICVDELANEKSNRAESKLLIDKATEASKRMNDFMRCTRHHIDSNEQSGILDITAGVMVGAMVKMTANLDDEIKNVGDIIAYKAKISEINFQIQSVENLVLRAHPMRIHQILLNLLGNSLEAKPKNIILQAERSGVYAKITVIDDGCGIPDEQLKNLFTKPRTTKSNGTGIGLICVYEIVKKELLGKIDVRSIVGKGTSFTIHLPLAV